jgi:hypothetical protein
VGVEVVLAMADGEPFPENLALGKQGVEYDWAKPSSIAGRDIYADT